MPREGIATQLLGEILDHVVAFELAVHQHVEAELLLPAHRIVDPAFDGRFVRGPRNILSWIPSLEHAEFLRFGQIHRNTYINAPALLAPTLQLRARPEILFAGQISGVEGYVEAIATGLAAGLHAATLASGGQPQPFPRETALGSLCHYISGADPRNYQPANITFDGCCRNSTKPPGRNCGAINPPVTRKSAGGPPRPWMSICTRMSELEHEIGRYLAELARRQASPHTLESYGGDLRQFLEYFTPPDSQPPPLAAIGVLEIREWLADLYTRQLISVSIRRKLAAVRSLFRFLSREGLIPMNPARLVRTPKAPKTLPDIMTAEQVNGLIDAVAADKFERATRPATAPFSSSCMAAVCA